MRRLTAIVTTIALLFIVTPVNADARCNGKMGVAIYQDVNYGGASTHYCLEPMPGYLTDAHLGNAPLVQGWNDRISSLYVFNAPSSRWHLRIYQNASFGGYYITTNGTTLIPDLSVYWASTLLHGFNDVASSWHGYYQ